MRKSQLVTIWKRLDRAYEALEILEENGVDIADIDLSAITSVKTRVEVMIEEKTKTAHVNLG